MLTTPAVSMLSLHNTANCAIQYIKISELLTNKPQKTNTKRNHTNKRQSRQIDELLEGKIKRGSLLIQ